MKTKNILTTLIFGMLFAVAQSAAFAQAAPAAVSMTAKTNYPASSPEAKAVLEWIQKRSPEYSPLMKSVSMQVVRKSQGAFSALAAASTSGPPTPLPSHGSPGDEYTVTNRDAAGNVETWGYTYSRSANAGEGGWVLMEYHYKAVNHDNQDSPETLG